VSVQIADAKGLARPNGRISYVRSVGGDVDVNMISRFLGFTWQRWEILSLSRDFRVLAGF